MNSMQNCLIDRKLVRISNKKKVVTLSKVNIVVLAWGAYMTNPEHEINNYFEMHSKKLLGKQLKAEQRRRCGSFDNSLGDQNSIGTVPLTRLKKAIALAVCKR